MHISIIPYEQNYKDFFPKNLLRCELMKKEKKCNQAAQSINRGEQSQLGTVFCFLSHMLKIFP